MFIECLITSMHTKTKFVAIGEAYMLDKKQTSVFCI